jgi:hypothetical protein
MPQPLLHLADVSVMCEGVRRRGRPQQVHTEPAHVDGNACLHAVLAWERNAHRKRGAPVALQDNRALELLRERTDQLEA